jgi:hypothetical protein
MFVFFTPTILFWGYEALLFNRALITHFVEQSLWEANNHSASQGIPCPPWNRFHKSPPMDPILGQINSVYYPHLHLGLPSGLLTSSFPTKMLHALLISYMHATCPAHLIFLHLITLLFGKEYKLCTLVCDPLQPPITLSQFQTYSPLILTPLVSEKPNFTTKPVNL